MLVLEINVSRQSGEMHTPLRPSKSYWLNLDYFKIRSSRCQFPTSDLDIYKGWYKEYESLDFLLRGSIPGSHMSCMQVYAISDSPR